MTNTFARSLVAAAALLAAGAAFADPGGVRQACHDDMIKFCPDSHGFSIIGCMKKHADEVSDQCKAAWSAHHKPQPATGASSAPATPPAS
jgi:hypothetical protein